MMIVEKIQDLAGKYRVRAKLGNGDTEFFKFDHDPTDEQVARVVVEYEARLLAFAKSAEFESIDNALLSGSNPFINPTYTHLTRLEAIGLLLQKYANATADVLIHFAPLVMLVSDDELAQLGLTPEAIQALRERIDYLLQAKAMLDNYQPLLL